MLQAVALRERAEYNAFGYDSRGQVANIARLMFGENWCQCPDQQHIPCCNDPWLHNLNNVRPSAEYMRPLPTTWNFVLHLPYD